MSDNAGTNAYRIMVDQLTSYLAMSADRRAGERPPNIICEIQWKNTQGDTTDAVLITVRKFTADPLKSYLILTLCTATLAGQHREGR